MIYSKEISDVYRTEDQLHDVKVTHKPPEGIVDRVRCNWVNTLVNYLKKYYKALCLFFKQTLSYPYTEAYMHKHIHK